ncbi:retrovirus-related pol polyprotein from transposon TNT 1-94, partial [Tanacetum coccineum]
AKFVRDFKSLANKDDKSLAKHKALEFEIERLLRAVVSQDIMSFMQNPTVVETSDLQTEHKQCKYDKISYDKAYKDMQQKIERLQAQLGDQKGKSEDTLCVSDTLDPLSRKLENENVELEFQEKLHNTIYENAKFRAQLFDKVSEQKDITKGTSENTKFANQSTVGKPSWQSLRNNFVMRQTNAFQSERQKFQKLGFLQSNTKNDRVPSASKSSCIKNKDVEVEEHHRNLPLSKNKKHMSSECNNVKLAIWNDKSEVVCAMCKQCLLTANHDVCVLNYVNGMNSHDDKHSANVSKIANQKKHKPRVKKPEKVGSKEILASPKPSKPRICLRWSPTGRTFNFKGKIITSSESECQSDSSNGDNACTSNPQESTIKRFPNSTSFLGSFWELFALEMIILLRYDDLQWGNILITRVYFVEGLGHNLFSVGQFCDSDLEVPFKRNTCFVRNLEEVDLLKGNRTTNLYTINLHKMASASPICLMARSTSTNLWLWHQRLSHLNFDTVNDLAKNDLVTSLPKFKYHKEYLCPSYEQGKKQQGISSTQTSSKF